MKHKDEFILLLLSACLFLPFLGQVHLFDWDEINFAESAREMMITRNWFQVQVNFNPFWEKPPLFFWLQVISMKAFGISEFSARLPNAICGILTLQVFFYIGKRIIDRRFGWLWVLLYAGSFLPHLYFKSGIIDPWFNLFIFLSIYQLYLTIRSASQNDAIKHAILAGLFSGLSILTKGPVGFLLLLLTFLVWWAINRFKKPASAITVLLFALTTLVTTFLWFGVETITNGPWFLVEFVTYQLDLLLHPVAGHKQPFYYHFIVVLIGCFPLSVLALPGFHRSFKGDDALFSSWMKYLFWVVMILFSLVTTKIVHYSSMAYLPLSFIAALVVYRYINQSNRLKSWQNNWILIQGLVMAFALLVVPLLLMFKNDWNHLITDPFVNASLNAPLEYFGFEWVVGLLYFTVVVIAYKLNKHQLNRGVKVLTLGTALTIFLTMPLVVPMVESISQRPAIAFFKEHQGKEVLLETYGYKSYAHYYYGRLQPENAHQMDEHKLIVEQTPIIVSVKLNRLERFNSEYPKATFLYKQGGFAFYQLLPQD